MQILNCLKFCFLYFIINLIINNSYSQNNNILENSDSAVVINNYGSAIFMPPLQALIDSAIVNSSIIHQNAAQIEISKYNLKSIKTEWLKYIQPVASYSYGASDALVLSSITNTGVISTNTSTRYNVGVKLSVNFFDIVDRKKQVSIAKEKINISEYQYQERQKQIASQVIVQYNTLLLSKKLLSLKNELYYNQLTNKKIGEQSFSDGDIAISEYSKVIEAYAKAKNDLEIAKSNLMTNMMLLEEYVGVKFSNFKNNK